MTGIFTYREAIFEQGTILSSTYPPRSPLHGGICLSLVWTWMKEFVNKPAGTSASRMAKCREKFLQSGARQSMYSDMLESGAKAQAVQDAPRKFLGLKSSGFHTTGNSFNCLESLCTKSNYDKTFHEIGFYFSQGGGHSTGLYIGPNSLSFFDPNFGEFGFPWTKWKVFFDALAALYGSGSPSLTVNFVTAQQISKSQSLIDQWQGRIDALSA